MPSVMTVERESAQAMAQAAEQRLLQQSAIMTQDIFQ